MSSNEPGLLQPPSLVPNDEALETQIKNKLMKKKRSRLLSVLSRHSRSSVSEQDEEDLPQHRQHDETSQDPIPEDAIHHSDEPVDQPVTDVFQWARLFENQRGIYLLGIPRYSRNVLLPMDPWPYTVPTAESGREGREAMKTPYSLQDFQLPDKNWKWVGDWSVEMYGDGQVAYDGFTYNWIFRRKGWIPKAGLLRFVRRRSWVRLMMLPASSSLPSMQHKHSRVSLNTFGEEDITWRGDDEDWHRCHAAMKLMETDGRKLELWRRWLGVKPEEIRRRVQWTEDADIAFECESEANCANDELLPIKSSKANLDYVVPVLAKHQLDIVQSFKYPESRAKFVEIITQTGLDKRLAAEFTLFGTSFDFWSRSSGLSGR